MWEKLRDWRYNKNIKYVIGECKTGRISSFYIPPQYVIRSDFERHLEQKLRSWLYIFRAFSHQKKTNMKFLTKVVLHIDGVCRESEEPYYDIY